MQQQEQREQHQHTQHLASANKFSHCYGFGWAARTGCLP